MYSSKVLKRFVKDYKLPVQVVQEPYFNYFMDLYDEQYNTRSKFKLLQDSVSQFETEEGFLEEYYKIRDKIIKTIEAADAYKEFNSMKMDKFNVPNNGYRARDIFNNGYIERYFVSIDLKKANFQALKWLDKTIVLNCDTYEELVGMFTNSAYMKASKYLRQVILGNMNPKRQVKIERYMTEQILNLLLDEKLLEKEAIRMVSNDETVFEVSEEAAKTMNSEELTNRIKHSLNFDVDIEVYQLKGIGNTKFFVKEFINKEGYELMCVPLVYHAQVYKHYNNLTIEDNDLVFFYENQVCRFIKPIDFKSEDLKDECDTDEGED